MWNRGKIDDPPGPAPFFGQGDVIAFGYYPSPYIPTPGELHFDLAEDWSTELSGRLDVETVALHEIGHCLGLGHCRHPESMMWRAYRKEDRTLTPDAVAELARVYQGLPI